MATYTKLSLDEVKRFADFFGIGPVISFNPLENGAANSSFHLTTSDDNYVLSICDEKSQKEIGNLTKLLDYLKYNHFPTTKIIKSADGTAVASYQGKPVFLKRFIKGEVHKDLSPSMLMQLGESIADLHRIPAPDYLPTVFPYGVDFFPQVTSSDLNPLFRGWLERKKREIISAFQPDLPRGLVHGDIFYDNVLFSGDSLAAILDFEEASNYYLIFDLGMCAVGTCTEERKISLPKIEVLINGYQSKRELSTVERKSLQTFVQYGAAATSFWRFRQYNLVNPNKRESERFKEMIDLADNVAAIPSAQFINQLF